MCYPVQSPLSHPMFYHLVVFYQLHFSKLYSVNLSGCYYSLRYFFSQKSSHQTFRHCVHDVDYRYSHSCPCVSCHVACTSCGLFSLLLCAVAMQRSPAYPLCRVSDLLAMPSPPSLHIPTCLLIVIENHLGFLRTHRLSG